MPPLVGINRTAWGTKLLLTAVLAWLVGCISLCHKLRAQTFAYLCLNGCFTPPLAPHSLPPHPFLTRLPPIEAIHDILQVLKKLSQKTSSVLIACRISYKHCNWLYENPPCLCTNFGNLKTDNFKMIWQNTVKVSLSV